jgi:hypothetical protein
MSHDNTTTQLRPRSLDKPSHIEVHFEWSGEIGTGAQKSTDEIELIAECKRQLPDRDEALHHPHAVSPVVVKSRMKQPRGPAGLAAGMQQRCAEVWRSEV